MENDSGASDVSAGVNITPEILSTQESNKTSSSTKSSEDLNFAKSSENTVLKNEQNTPSSQEIVVENSSSDAEKTEQPQETFPVHPVLVKLCMSPLRELYRLNDLVNKVREVNMIEKQKLEQENFEINLKSYDSGLYKHLKREFEEPMLTQMEAIMSKIEELSDIYAYAIKENMNH